MRPRATPLALAAALAVAGAPYVACAQPRPAEGLRLAVTRDDGASSCPDAAVLRRLLSARLGRDAVRDDATRSATLRFRHSGNAFSVRIRLAGPHGHVTSRRLRAAANDCSRLGDAASLVLALAVDPLVAVHNAAEAPATANVPVTTPAPPPPAPPSPPPAPAPPPVVVTPVAVAPPRVARPAPVAGAHWQVGVLASLGVGVAPGVFTEALGAGLVLRVAPVRGRWMFPVELAVDAPGRLDDAARNATVSVLPTRLGAAGCLRFGARTVGFGCATAAAGAVFAWGGGYTPDRTGVAFAVLVGARAGVEVPVGPRWRLVASVDVAGLAVRPALSVGGSAGGVLWTAPPVAASLAIGAAWTNP